MLDDLFRSKKMGVTPLKLGSNALLLQNFLSEEQMQIIIDKIQTLSSISPFRHMKTPTGHSMSVAMTNCGNLGWVSDNKGYRYSAIDPLTNKLWPKMPSLFYSLACKAASHAGFNNFIPNACLINRYDESSKMSLHQDKDEKNLKAPIVSFSLGLPALFLWGGLIRKDKVAKITLEQGDAFIWGGIDRLRFHGVASILSSKDHTLLKKQRINLTFRQVH